ncbi:MAG: hypothetical protein GTO44_10070 [Hydrotalea flava]|nr:hypothetical protein [Hydrotalea flava]NIN15399.1 hypothetical protein [Hydrotalea flava]
MVSSWGKYTAENNGSFDTPKLESITDEFSFYIYETFTGNRKTLAIYRNVDGEVIEVNLILAHKKAKNIGKKIKAAISKLRKREINKLYQTYMKMLRKTTTFDEKRIVTHIKEMKSLQGRTMKHNMKFDDYLISEMDARNFKHDYVKYIKRVCRVCQKYGDCVEVGHDHTIPVCEKCRNLKDFDKIYAKKLDAIYESNGHVPPSKQSWCTACGGLDQPDYSKKDYDNFINDFGTQCTNPNCKRMKVCDIHNIVWNKNCEKNCIVDNEQGCGEYQYSIKKRFVTFDLETIQRVCRGCQTFGDCITIDKKPLCKNCKQIKIEKIDMTYGKLQKSECLHCHKYVTPSQNYVQMIQFNGFKKSGKRPKAHAKCYVKVFHEHDKMVSAN